MAEALLRRPALNSATIAFAPAGPRPPPIGVPASFKRSTTTFTLSAVIVLPGSDNSFSSSPRRSTMLSPRPDRS